MLLRYFVICRDIPRHVLHLKHLRTTCGDVRKNNLCNADAVFYFFFPFHVCEAVAVRWGPPGRSDSQHQTGSNNQGPDQASENRLHADIN